MSERNLHTDPLPGFDPSGQTVGDLLSAESGRSSLDPDHAAQDSYGEAEHRLAQADQWLNAQVRETVTYPEIVAEAQANNEPVPALFAQTEPVPDGVAPEVALRAQQRLGVWEKYDLFPDEVGGDLSSIRDRAIVAADHLDFGVVSFTPEAAWPQRVWLNSMHEKFTNVPEGEIRGYLGDDPAAYEYRALFIRNIIADNDPGSLTPELRVLMDPTQPMWRRCNAQASVLLRNQSVRNLNTYAVEQLPTALPTGNRTEYIAEDNQVMKPVHDMSDDELALYVLPQSIPEIRERGNILFPELNQDARETILARRLFEVSVKSSDPTTKAHAEARNRELEHDPILQEGDYVHATRTPEILEQVLSDGLRCGEAVTGNTRGQVNYPFTVSYIEVGDRHTAHESVAERLDSFHTAPYGAINLVLKRDPETTDYGREMPLQSAQRNIFGGTPSTEIKAIVMRDQAAVQSYDQVADGAMIQSVIDKVVQHGMYIPVYRASTGDLILSSAQYDQLREQRA